MEKLAYDGGGPVRKTPFPSNFLGVTMYGDEEMAELKDVIEDKSPFRHYGAGNPRKTEFFEREVKEYFGSKFALAVSSGTGALSCAVAALGVGPGDEVIIPTFGWYSDFYAVSNLGALPVFADIDETLSLDPADFERKITDKTKAAVVVAFQGGPPAMDKITEIAKRRGVKIIEDIAQAFGAEYKGKKLGTLGDIAIASFQQNKTLCCGEGGLVLTNDEKYFTRAARYHDLGMLRPLFAGQISDKTLLGDGMAFAGNQYRMNEFCGAVMRAQLKKLDGLLKTCRAYHKRVRDALAGEKYFKIRWTDDGDCGAAVFLLFGTEREAKDFQDRLSAEGVPLGPKSACKNLMTQPPVYNKSMTHPGLPPFGKGFDGEAVDYPALNGEMKTDGILARFIAISIGPQYTDNDIADIIKAIKKVGENLYG